MPHYTKLMPLAFALAMSLGGSSTETLSKASTADFFQPGRLTPRGGLFSQLGGDPAEPSADARPVRSAQWLNWFNCFTGVWRRC